jgi:catechol-2,3-dioxygenase
MSDTIRLSSTTINCPDATALARFYADITGGAVTFSHPSFATMISVGGRIDFQTVETFVPPRWPEQSGTIHLDFLVEDLEAAAVRVVRAGATRQSFQPNAAHCVVFADPVGHPFCLTTLDEIG